MQTFSINSTLYRSRYKLCGKESCKACSQDYGHLVYEKYEPAKPGQQRGRWIHYGPERPFGATDQRTCAADGCSNAVTLQRQKFCSAKCRVAWHRAQKQK